MIDALHQSEEPSASGEYAGHAEYDRIAGHATRE